MSVSAPTQSKSSSPVGQGILNVAAYKFVRLTDLVELRGKLREHCERLNLRGTVLLSPEGINLFIAGEPTQVDCLLDWLRTIPSFQNLEVKRSYSEKVPFRRMLVRLKKEIIPCGVETIQPGEKTSPKLAPKELKQWLDEGRRVRLLDVRNKYEVDLGTFHGAEHLELGHFRDFKEALSDLPADAKAEPLVMFCTGGIRCEKAGPLMEEEGYEQVYQLDGGILKYFEDCGGAHYDGSCFVFDGRVALNAELEPTGNLLCFNCQAVLTAEDVVSGRFLFGEYCPQCYEEPEQRRLNEIHRRQAKITDAAESQPGCTPYENVREIHVPGRFDGLTLIEFLVQWQPAIAREQWCEWLQNGEIQKSGPASPDQIVREGECFVHRMPNTVEPEINPNIELLHEDESLVVVNKPAPLPCHPSGRFNRNTLLSLLAPAYPNQKLRLTHRIDANTTGLVLFCRKYRAARLVQPQFAERKVEKKYLARVQGWPEWETMHCAEAISSKPKAAGVRGVDNIDGNEAESVFRVLERFDDGTTLIEAQPLTGRTNQLRIHLAHLKHPVLGDQIHGSSPSSAAKKAAAGQDTRAMQSQVQPPTLSTSDSPMCLHSASLQLIHPDTSEQVTYRAPTPPWAKGT